MTPVRPEQTAAILRLSEQGLDRNAIAERVGVTPGQVSAVRAVAARSKHHTETSSDQAIDDVIDTMFGLERDLQEWLRLHITTFGLERDLQKWLRRNIADLERELSITDEGHERKVASGFIDITGRDRDGAAVVIELKAGTADRDALGQILAYMGDLMTTEKSVRGILIASEFTPRAIAAARATRNVQLIRYGIRFSFAPAFPDPASA
jgi:endonuclease